MVSPVIGIEIHAQLKTTTKLFCGCLTQFGDPPNTHVCPVCTGSPGALPVLNKQAVRYAIMAGLALNGRIQPVSVFARKNYFYPDLPKGYQISQYDRPIVLGGWVDIPSDGGLKRIGITRIHIEEDAGKLLHQGSDTIAGSSHSIVDLNRASTPLIEIVTEPDIRSASEARWVVERIRETLVHLGICDGNMEEGSLRADINVSIREDDTAPFGTRCEIKNVNSFRSIERAIHIEMSRQAALLAKGEAVIQQTRQYDEATQTTRTLRDKEESHDYRYFPDPDLTPLVIESSWIEAIKTALPEQAAHRRVRYKAVGLSDFETDVLLADPQACRYLDTVADAGIPHPIAAKWIVGDLNAHIKDRGHTFANSAVPPAYLVELLTAIMQGTLSGKLGKSVLSACFETGESPQQIIAKTGQTQVSDEGELSSMVGQICAQHPDVVAKVKAGKGGAIQFLMGQVMKETKGRANPDMVKGLLEAHLNTLNTPI